MKSSKRGRPSLYTPQLVEEICEAIANSNKGLTRLCEENSHWPNRRNIYRWLKKDENFCLMYARAKENQIEYLIDEILEIADNTSQDNIIKTDEEGNTKSIANNEWINRSRLRIDTRKWLAAKLCPRIYGDRFQGNAEPSPHEQSLKDLE